MVVNYIGEFSGVYFLEINQLIYIFIRDYVLFELIIVNVYRSGVLVNMIIGEFEKVKETK